MDLHGFQWFFIDLRGDGGDGGDGIPGRGDWKKFSRARASGARRIRHFLSLHVSALGHDTRPRHSDDFDNKVPAVVEH